MAKEKKTWTASEMGRKGAKAAHKVIFAGLTKQQISERMKAVQRGNKLKK